MKKRHRIYSIYLPQFHPLPENDKFWGKGFTEWHNVTAGRSLFKGHHQPHLPTELGFYDLRLPDVMQEQSDLASQFGIDGFIFYHYWFNGRPLMEKPIENYRRITARKLPYFFCWANENWSRRWDGGDKDILLEQNYSSADDEKHFEFFRPFFDDDKYTRIDNRPVIGIYRPRDIPNLKEWVKNMESLAKKSGFDGLYFIYFINIGIDHDINISDYGFDAGLVFQPSWKGMPIGGRRIGFMDKVGKALFLLKLCKRLPINYRHERISYPLFVEDRIKNSAHYPFKCFQSIFPGWDNSARRKNGGGRIFTGSNPKIFAKWLQYLYDQEPYSNEENFIVINAWNEWAEGNHLEPCTRWGRAYLEAVKSVLTEDNSIL